MSIRGDLSAIEPAAGKASPVAALIVGGLPLLSAP